MQRPCDIPQHHDVMPPQFLFDLSTIDLDQVLFDQEAVREANPQRGDMEHLNGIIYAAPELDRILGFKDVRHDEFWIPGHIPGRPLLPGVIMIECGAQLASFYSRKFIGWKGFIGFGGLGECKFRMEVPPGVRMLILGQKIWERHHRLGCNIQGVVEGNVAFEAMIIGVEM
jgi:3-hydroxyacyl-[acyl-carrier-protein] dehydratase